MPKAKPCATPLALPRRFRTPIIIAWQCYSCCTIVTMQSRLCDGCLNVERSQKAIAGPEHGWLKSTKFSFLGKRRNGLATQPRIIAIVGCWTFALARPCNLRHRKNTVVLACVRPTWQQRARVPQSKMSVACVKSFTSTGAFPSSHVLPMPQKACNPNSARNMTVRDASTRQATSDEDNVYTG